MVRPTMARIKEALFNIIKPYVNDAVFLDLFSGTGSIALEALSRGAKRAVMIEKNSDALKIIIENVNNMGFSDRCRAYKNEAVRAIEILDRKREKFDIIFMDPPYTQEFCEETIKKIEASDILKKTGILIAEHHMHERLEDTIGELKKVDERDYGGKVLSFYTY